MAPRRPQPGRGRAPGAGRGRGADPGPGSVGASRRVARRGRPARGAPSDGLRGSAPQGAGARHRRRRGRRVGRGRGDSVPTGGRGLRRDHPRRPVAQRRRVRGVRHRARGRRCAQAGRGQLRGGRSGADRRADRPQQPAPAPGAARATGCWSTERPAGSAPSRSSSPRRTAPHVTGVDHARKLALVRSLGADRVIDYTSEDYTRGGERWDLIFDVPGNHPFEETRRALEPGGSLRADRARRVRRHRTPLARQHPAPARVGGALGRGPRAARWLLHVTGQARS